MGLGMHYATILPLVALGGLVLSLIAASLKKYKLHKLLFKYSTLVLVIGWLIYMIPFIILDYRLAEVAENSSDGLNLIFRMATSWSGGGSSLYFFSTITALGALYLSRRGGGLFLSIALGIILTISLSSATLNGAFDIAEEGGGIGLNPLLKSYWIVPHPLTTFSGYSLILVSSLALLSSYRRDAIALLILGWSLLSLGITFGAYWSYETFGWGGYWAWDPVEVAELAVWLGAVSALHTLGPLAPLRKPILAMLASSVPLALYVTRSGLSPLHSFASANIGSVILLSLGIGFLGLSIYYLSFDEESKSAGSAVKKALTNRDMPGISIIIGGGALIVMFIYVYSSLLAPSILTAIGKQATIPNMAEGVRFYHPVLYPLILLAIVALPGFFLAREVGSKGYASILIITGIMSLTAVTGVDRGVLELAPLSPNSTNILMALGLVVSTMMAGMILVSLLYPLLAGMLSGRVTRIKPRDIVAKAIHLGMLLTLIGILFSGTYAFNDSYFKTFKLKLGEETDIGDAKVVLEGFEFERSPGSIDLYTHISGKRTTSFLAWQAVNFLKADIVPAIREVRLAASEARVNSTIKAIKELLVNNYFIYGEQDLIVNGTGDIIMTDIITNTNLTLAVNTIIKMIFKKPLNITIDASPIVSESGELSGAWIGVGVGSNGVILLANMSGPDIMAGSHTYYNIIFSNPVAVKLNDEVTVYIREAALYPGLLEGNGSKGFGRIIDGGVELFNPYMIVVGGYITYNGIEIPLSTVIDRGLYLYVAMSRGQAEVLEDAMSSTLSKVLTDDKVLLLLSSSEPGKLPFPRSTLEGVKLKLHLKIIDDDREDYVTPVIRFEANGEALGIHGLVTDTVIVERGLSDLYISVQPPKREGYFNVYHELLIYYLREASQQLEPEEYLSLIALMSAGYNIGGVRSMDHSQAGFQVEQSLIDLYLLAERFDPLNSTILSEGIDVMVKVVPGVDLIWIGVAIMVASGILSSILYARATERRHPLHNNVY